MRARNSSPVASPSDESQPTHEFAVIHSPQANSEPGPLTAAASNEEAEFLHASIKAGSVAQIVVAVVAVLGLLYVLKLVMVTTLTCMLLAFVLEPLVGQLRRIRVPRTAGALIAVILMVATAGSLTYFFYNRAVGFAMQLQQYSGRIRETLGTVRQDASTIEESTRSVMASPDGKRPVPVEVRGATGLSGLVSAGAGTIAEVIGAIGFAPFLVYFMLTWKDHAHAATVRLFAKEHRMMAHRTIGKITQMIRVFITGNLLVGLINALLSTVVFWRLHIPYFYFLGFISGFVSLIPYLGVFLALLPPFAGGIGILDKTGTITIVIMVIGLHVLTMNVLYPKFVGRRLRLNPLAVTLALLFWAWIWGAMGLILAIPRVGATKLICDYTDSLRGLGQWLGD
jgi:predicted PurR-regulated permease PerM